ncbi:hypothetical protein C1H46_003723 [Malus baccata]|uniref:Uncharacterized protein n=1 Tax=Malus baccata TaxID=106549 RepID=A0A540NJE6_MALBA|nr:hypothetical protein C1H46_003723 [Malus baccata]
MEEDGGEQPRPPYLTSSEALTSDPHLDPQSTCPDSTLDPSEDKRTDSKPPLMNQIEIFRALEVVKFNRRARNTLIVSTDGAHDAVRLLRLGLNKSQF